VTALPEKPMQDCCSLGRGDRDGGGLVSLQGSVRYLCSKGVKISPPGWGLYLIEWVLACGMLHIGSC
jgi:hypothetical protein